MQEISPLGGAGVRRDRRAVRPRRTIIAGRRLVATFMLVALVCVGCGSSRHHASHPGGSPSATPSHGGSTPGAAAHPRPLRVVPSDPRSRSEIAFSFVAPVATGRRGTEEIGYSLSVTGPVSGRCIGADEAGGPAARAGRRVTIVDGPRQTGRAWCPGDYTARVLELARAACGEQQVCPQYIRVVADVAVASFRIRG